MRRSTPSLKVVTFACLVAVQGLPAAQAANTNMFKWHISSLKVATVKLTLQGAALPPGATGTSYQGHDFKSLLSATGDPAFSLANVSWQITAGTLPTGLQLNADGVLSGTPLAAGSSQFAVTASYKGQSASAAFTLTVEAPSRTVALSPAVSGKTSWNLDVDGPLILGTTGVYTLTPQYNLTSTVKMWAAGGGGGQPYPGNEAYVRGGGGGAAVGVVPLAKGNTYTVVVGSAGSNVSAGTHGFGGNGSNGSYNLRGGGGGGLSGLFLGASVTSTSAANALLIAGGGGGGGSSAWGGTQACVATSGGGASVLSVSSSYGGATPLVAAPTYTTAAPGASGMRGGNSVFTSSDGAGGGGGGYQGGGAAQGVAQGCNGGTGGLGYVGSMVTNGATYTGGLGLGSFYNPGLVSDADRGTAGTGGAASSQGTGGKVILR